MGQKTSKLNKEDLSKLKNETQFSARELQQWYKGFKRDAPEGHLTKDAFIKIHKQFYPFGDPVEFSNYAFKAFNLDDKDSYNNGILQFKSFIISLSIASRGTIQDRLKWSFKMYDREDAGVVKYDDLLKVIKSIYKMVGYNAVKFDEDEVTPEMRADKLWTAYGKSLNNKSNDEITLSEFMDMKYLDEETLNSLNIYNNLI